MLNRNLCVHIILIPLLMFKLYFGVIFKGLLEGLPYSSTLAWKIPWTEEPGGLQSMGSLGVRHDWVTSLSLFTFHFYALEKEMATHSSVLPWRIPGTWEPGGLPSMGSHRVGHDWSDLAAAAAAEGLQYASLIYWNLHLSNTEKSNSKFVPKKFHFLFSFCMIIFMYINEMIYKFNNKVL